MDSQTDSAVLLKSLWDFFCKESLRRNGGNNEDEENSCCSDSDSNSESGNETSSESSDLYIESYSSDSNAEDAEDDRPFFQDSRLTYREHLLSAIAYATKHNLNLSQTTDLLELIELHTAAKGCKTERSVNNLKRLSMRKPCKRCYSAHHRIGSNFPHRHNLVKYR